MGRGGEVSVAAPGPRGQVIEFTEIVDKTPNGDKNKTGWPVKRRRNVTMSAMRCRNAPCEPLATGPIFGTAMLMLLALGGCSSDKSDDPAGAGGDGGSGGGLKHYAGAQPCEGFSTDYKGDEYCIREPEAGTGMQLHYGPSNYDDQAEVDKYLIQPGDEVTDCLFMKTPNTDTVFVNQYHARMRPGSHHMITYTQSGSRPDSVAPEGCNQGTSSRFLVGSQEPTIDILRDDNAPEQKGYAMQVGPTLQAAVQLHYINTTNEPLLKEAWINVVFADPAIVTTHVEPIFWIGGYGMNVPVGQKQIIRGECAVPSSAAENMHLLQVTGHYHAHTVRFTAWKVDGSGQRIRIYESYDYNDPGFTYFNTRDINEMPDPLSKTFGSDYNGQLFMKPGERVEWECEVDNTEARNAELAAIDPNFEPGPLRFANAVYEAEMCNMFGTYAPSTGAPWSCYSL
jgi:hypothetical protein